MNPVLVDSSVWIGYFRHGDTTDANDLDVLLKSKAVCLTAIIRAELLSGTRTEKDYDLLADTLSAIQMLPDTPQLWEEVAHARFCLARRGIQASLLDLSIAIQSVHYKCPLFTTDIDFKSISSFLRLKLYRPLPRPPQ